MSTALVTGGATRLGRAFSIALASKGYNIALHYNSSSDEAEEVKTIVESHGVQCQLFAMNFAENTDHDGFLAEVTARFDDLTVLISSASLYYQYPLMETSQQVFNEQMQVNLFTPYFLTQSFAKYLQGKNAQGNVINIVDNKVAFNQYQYSAYLLTKKTLVEFIKMAALELAPTIRVNGISPGVILPMESRSEDYLDWRVKGIPLAKQGSPDYLVKAMFYLLDNDFITGQIMTVDGGESITNVGRNAGDFDTD